MARKQLIVFARLRSSSILEVVISMIVIVLVFGIAMMIFNNVIRVSLSLKKIKAQAALQQYLQIADKNKNLTSQTVTLDNFIIQSEISPYGQNNLTTIKLIAYDENKVKVTELEKIIPAR